MIVSMVYEITWTTTWLCVLMDVLYICFQTYSNWAPGQPRTEPGNKDEDCLFLYGPANYTWHDGPCSYLAHPLCELT